MIGPDSVVSMLSTVVRTYGARGLALRALHEARKTTGSFLRSPRWSVDSRALSEPWLLRPDLQRFLKAINSDRALDRAGHVVRGEYQAYRSEWRALPLNAADWRRNSISGYTYDGTQPWWSVKHVDRRAGDIKDLWEPARFAWAYDLARAHLMTGDDLYVRAFETHLANWYEGNPPFYGPHWSCGQETAIRAIALIYAEAAFAARNRAHGRYHKMLIDVLSASGERIADAIGYGLSQRNNHGISEATGLVVLGLRLRGAHPDAVRWLARGRAEIERLIVEQFADDGWYIQHSFNYLRLALDQCVIAQHALRSAGEPGLSDASRARLAAGCGLIMTLIDGETGAVPNYGSNDGAFVHPVTTANYSDYRPVVTTACALFGKSLPSDIRGDAECLAWLSMDAPAVAAARKDDVVVGRSGWAVVRSGTTTVFLRAGEYHSRPGQLDPLQLDIRLEGSPLVVDPGTYSYHGEPPWNNGLAAARVHNGPMPDNEEPGIRGPRFLWLKWPSARITSARLDDGATTVSAEIPGRVSRDIVVTDGMVTVTDKTLDESVARVRICWLLHPSATIEQFDSETPCRVIEASDDDTVAWFSPSYGERIPSRALVAELSGTGQLTITSRFLGRRSALTAGSDSSGEVISARSV